MAKNAVAKSFGLHKWTDGTYRSKPQPGIIFFDDFSGPGIDTTKWTVVQRLSDQENDELDAVLAANAAIKSGGGLEITSKHEDYTIGDAVETKKLMHYTSGHLQQRTAPFQYGKVTVRAKCPGGTGLWPLAWLLGYAWQPSQPYTANTPEHNWPHGQWCEVDLMEFLSNSRTTNNCAVWFYNSTTGNGSASGADLNHDASSRFINYQLEWDVDLLRWSADEEDGNGYHTLREIIDPDQIPDVPMYVILSTAIGGVGAGTPDPDTFPQTYTVDRVIVEQ